jgi:hypothetical protein
MAEQSSHTDPEVPDWALRAMEKLPTLVLEAGVERDLLDAVFILLRARYGLSSLPDPRSTGRLVIKEVLTTLNAERPLEEVINEMESDLTELKSLRNRIKVNRNGALR